jgi:arylsulfatase
MTAVLHQWSRLVHVESLVSPFANPLMNTKPLSILCLWLLVASIALPASPNIVLINIDDMGYADIEPFGAVGYKTPHLNAMAAAGARYTNFHVTQPVCSASRTALLTGCYSNRIGIHGALGPQSKIGIAASEVTFAEIVKEKGYATCAIGKWHLGHHPQFLPTQHGFDEYFGLPYSNDMWPFHPTTRPGKDGKGGYPPLPLIDGATVVDADVTADDQTQLTTQYTERAVAFIEKNKGGQFFVYLAHSMCHVPLFVSKKHEGKTQRGLFGDVIEELDWSVGQVMAALKRAGVLENTLVIFTSDNGPWLSYGDHAGSAGAYREGKGTTWEGGVRVPCIMQWPNRIPAGATQDKMFMTIDLLPTIAKLVGAQLPEHTIDGKDVWPLMSLQPGATNPHDFYAYYYEQNQLQSLVSGDGRWKLRLPHVYRTMTGQEQGKGGIPGKYAPVPIEKTELYDLETDPGEKQDVADQHPNKVAQLQSYVQEIRSELGDSLTKQTGNGNRLPGRVME